MTEPAPSASPDAGAAPPGPPAVLAEVARRTKVCWVRVPASGPARGLWHVWASDACLVVVGGGEQAHPELEAAPAGSLVHVTMASKDSGGRLVTWVGRVEPVTPEDSEWAPVTAALAAERLNATDGDAAPQRWAATSRVLRLVPTGELVEAPGTLPSGSLAAPPVPSPAVTRGRLPFVLGRRSGRRPRRS